MAHYPRNLLHLNMYNTVMLKYNPHRGGKSPPSNKLCVYNGGRQILYLFTIQIVERCGWAMKMQHNIQFREPLC